MKMRPIRAPSSDVLPLERRISLFLSRAVDMMYDLGVEPTLTEISAMRRYIIEGASQDSRGSEACSPTEAVARLLHDYYGIDYGEVQLKDKNRKPPINALFYLVEQSRLCGDHRFEIDPAFKAYMRIEQAKQYFP